MITDRYRLVQTAIMIEALEAYYNQTTRGRSYYDALSTLPESVSKDVVADADLSKAHTDLIRRTLR